MSLQSKISVLKFSALKETGNTLVNKRLANGLGKTGLPESFVKGVASLGGMFIGGVALCSAVVLGFTSVAAIGMVAVTPWALPVIGVMAFGTWCLAGFGMGMFEGSANAQMSRVEATISVPETSANDHGLGKKSAVPGFNKTVGGEKPQGAPSPVAKPELKK